MVRYKNKILLQTIMTFLPLFVLLDFILIGSVPYIKISIFVVSVVLYFLSASNLQQHMPGKKHLDICEEYDRYSVKTINWLFINAIYGLSIIANILMILFETKEIAEIGFYFGNFISFGWIFLSGFVYCLRYTLYLIKEERIGKAKRFIPELKKVSVVTLIGFIFSIVICYVCEWALVKNPIIVMWAIWIAAVIIYQRRRTLFSNHIFRIRKSVIIIFVIAFIGGLFSYNLYKDVWLIQPYINSVPNLSNDEIKVKYNEETGIYTLTTGKDDFKILQLTDIHLGGSAISYSKDIKAFNACYKLIEQTKPDFVIVTGDLTFPLGVMSFSFNNKAPVEQFASFMRNIGIPWAFTYGNHDSENMSSLNASELNDVFKNLSYKTSKTLLYPYIQPDITGRNNQLIEVRKSDGSLIQALFLIDSNAYTGKGLNEYDYIHDDQVEWYASEVKRLQEESNIVKSLVFMHIPLQEYKTAYDLYTENNDEVKYFFGEIGETMIDSICTSDYPSKFFDTAVGLGSTQGIFCGHDHYNNISLEYKGIRLTYGMSIDYLAMPGIERGIKQRGATLITISGSGDMEVEQCPLKNME